MKAGYLLQQSKVRFFSAGKEDLVALSPAVFTAGAQWMARGLGGKRVRCFDSSIPYTFYGLLKYGVSIATFGLSAVWLLGVSPFLVPLSILVFYFFEVHFLFLFPLLVAGTKNPIWDSVRLTYRIGLFNAITTVMAIGFYMLGGLFQLRHPLRNWHIGCGAILIWYEAERGS